MKHVLLSAFLLVMQSALLLGKPHFDLSRWERAFEARDVETCAVELSEYTTWLVKSGEGGPDFIFRRLLQSTEVSKDQEAALFLADLLSHYYGDMGDRYFAPIDLLPRTAFSIFSGIIRGAGKGSKISKKLSYLQKVYADLDPQTKPLVGTTILFWLKADLDTRGNRTEARNWLNSADTDPDFDRFIDLGIILAEHKEGLHPNFLLLEKQDWSEMDAAFALILEDEGIPPLLRVQLGGMMLGEVGTAANSIVLLNSLEALLEQFPVDRLWPLMKLHIDGANAAEAFGASDEIRSAAVDLIVSWWREMPAREKAFGGGSWHLWNSKRARILLLLADRQDEEEVRAVIDHLIAEIEPPSHYGSFPVLIGLIAVGEFELARSILPGPGEVFSEQQPGHFNYLLTTALSENLEEFYAGLTDPVMGLRIDAGLVRGTRQWEHCRPPAVGTAARAERVIARGSEISTLPELIRQEILGHLSWRDTLAPHLQAICKDIPYPQLPRAHPGGHLKGIREAPENYLFLAKLKGLLAQKDWEELRGGLGELHDQGEDGAHWVAIDKVVGAFGTMGMFVEVAVDPNSTEEDLNGLIATCHHLHALCEDISARGARLQSRENFPHAFAKLASIRLGKSYDYAHVRTLARTEKGKRTVGSGEASQSTLWAMWGLIDDDEKMDPATSEATVNQHARRLLLSEVFCKELLRDGYTLAKLEEKVPGSYAVAKELVTAEEAGNPYFLYLAAQQPGVTNHLPPPELDKIWFAVIDGFEGEAGTTAMVDDARVSLGESLAAQGQSEEVPFVLQGLSDAGGKRLADRISKLLPVSASAD